MGGLIDEAADETGSKMFVVVLGTVVANEAGQVVLFIYTGSSHEFMDFWWTSDPDLTADDERWQR